MLMLVSTTILSAQEYRPTGHEWKKGLVMAGYQGWFNTPTDGANRGWHHYQRDGRFEPGYCTIDFWPEVSEYPKTYKTDFKFADGSPAYVFSPHDESTVDVHFKWMQEYGLDGVFMQRFVSEIRNPSGAQHFTQVLGSATKAAAKHDRTLAVMYDLSGSRPEEMEVVEKDWKMLLEKFHYDDRSRYGNYLYYKERPVVAIWGVGFNDNRKYDLKDIERLIRFFKSDEGGNCSILLGVPTYWREQGRDCVKDPDLHRVIQMADIVHPWFVGRFDSERYEGFHDLIGKDKAWCDAHGLQYMPVVFPGFSWNNMHPQSTKSSTIPRMGGKFLWQQLHGASEEGAEAIYVAMFDEIDEGTAIFKVAHKVPVGKSTFVPLETGLKPDHYLWLVGKAAETLKTGETLPAAMPQRKD